MTRVKTWTDGLVIEDAAQEQINRVAAMPFIYKHVAIMPDVHWGCGATIGSVIPTLGAIIPAAVGVDLGCGMSARRTNLTASDLPDNLFSIRCAIEAAVPHGRTEDLADAICEFLNHTTDEDKAKEVVNSLKITIRAL